MQRALRLLTVVPVRASNPGHARAFSSTAAKKLDLDFDYHAPSDKVSPKHAPIVFLHGLFGSKKNNRSISKSLARTLNRPIYALDLRNHGSSPHDPRHDYSALADDVEEFINKHELEETTLIGHSMGAKTAMVVALRSPSLVSNLIPVDNAPIDAALKSDFSSYVKGMYKIEEAKVKSQREADEIMKAYAKELERYLKWRIPVRYLGKSLDNMADFPYKNPEEIRFNKPTLFVRGTKSHYVADEALPIIGQFFPRFELADIEAGHWVISENPKAFQDAVVEFLDRVGPKP